MPILEKNRNIGLDVLRAIAILLVLISHGRMFFHSLSLQPLSFGGFYGVEIFFVLSGYLIGKIIIRDFITSKQIKLSNLLKFYLWRILRTWPLYYILLIILYICGNKFDWHYMLFLQNFNDKQLSLWGVTWSLTIEEYYYIIFPMLILVMSIFNNNKSYIFLMIFFILIENILRIYLKLHYDWNMSTIRKTLYLQFDSIAIGGLLSYIKIFNDKLFDLIAKQYYYGLILFFLNIIIYVSYGFGGINYEHSILCSTINFDIAALSVFLIIPFFEKSIWQDKLFTKALQITGLISYSLYLIHYKIFIYLSNLPIITNSSKFNQLMEFLIAMVLVYMISFLSYYFIERNFLKNRQRIFNFLSR